MKAKIDFCLAFFVFFQISFICALSIRDVFLYALLKSDVTRSDHVSVVMDAGSRIVSFIVNFIRNGTVFA